MKKLMCLIVVLPMLIGASHVKPGEGVNIPFFGRGANGQFAPCLVRVVRNCPEFIETVQRWDTHYYKPWSACRAFAQTTPFQAICDPNAASVSRCVTPSGTMRTHGARLAATATAAIRSRARRDSAESVTPSRLCHTTAAIQPNRKMDR